MEIKNDHAKILSSIVNYLSNPRDREFNQEKIEEIANKFGMLLREYVEKNLQEEAKNIWILETIFKIQIDFFNAFLRMKSREYMEAWYELIHAERLLEYLERHYNYSKDTEDKYSLQFIKRGIEKYQGIYPPFLYISPAMVIKKVQCSICGKILALRNGCGHELREIYDGKLCLRYIKDFELSSAAITEKPRWKWRVLNSERPKYNFLGVSHLLDVISNPYDEWDFSLTKTGILHNSFLNFTGEDDCPCGSSKKYKECCLEKEYVIIVGYMFQTDSYKQGHYLYAVPFEPTKKNDTDEKDDDHYKFTSSIFNVRFFYID